MKLLIQLGHTLIIKYVSVNTFANTSNINRFLEEVMVLNSPPGSLQLRPYVMVVLLFQLSGRRRGTIWLRRSLPLHLQVKRTFKQNIVVCVSIPLVSWCFTSMRGHSNCDYGSTQNTQKSFLETVCRSRHIQYVRYGWSLNQVYLLCTHLWHKRSTNLRWDVLGGLNPDCGVPFSRRQDSHLIEELINPREEICSVLGLVCHIMEDLYNEFY